MRPTDRLRRWMQSKGYGIHSPKDYAFVREVLTEALPYYSYEELCRGLSRRDRVLGCLYMRIANWLRPSLIADPAGDKNAFWRAGCQSVTISRDLQNGCGLLRLSSGEQAESLATRFAEQSDSRSVLIIEKIGRGELLEALWQRMTGSDNCGTTFDAGPCGIVWFDTDREKHHYKIII